MGDGSAGDGRGHGIGNRTQHAFRSAWRGLQQRSKLHSATSLGCYSWQGFCLPMRGWIRCRRVWPLVRAAGGSRSIGCSKLVYDLQAPVPSGCDYERVDCAGNDGADISPVPWQAERELPGGRIDGTHRSRGHA
jgi:hypothetical protein